VGKLGDLTSGMETLVDFYGSKTELVNGKKLSYRFNSVILFGLLSKICIFLRPSNGALII
jgi:hypothetical protein